MSDNPAESLSPAPDMNPAAKSKTPDLCEAAHAGAQHLRNVATANVAERVDAAAIKIRKYEHDRSAAVAITATGFTLQHPLVALSSVFAMGWVIGLLCDRISSRLR